MNDFDVILAGGGLANGAIALALKATRPDLRIAVIDALGRLGGDHTWSFHGSDIPEDGMALLRPMIRASWPSQDVVFRDHCRTLTTSYHSIASADLHRIVEARVGRAAVLLNRRITGLAEGSVTLEDGQTLTAPCVIDGRGWTAEDGQGLVLGYQKFLGQEMIFSAPHGVTRPVIMDASVDQIDGYRFVYCLPFSETEMLVEDTYYADGSALGRDILEARLDAYARQKGWPKATVTRTEIGRLPIVLAGEGDPFAARTGAVARVGLRGGFFHPTTGYSLPDAVRLALEIGRLGTLTSSKVAALAARMSGDLWRQRGFYRLLNRMLFVAAEDAERHDIMQRFYTLPQDLIERFYAGRITGLDKLRILSGRPPLPVLRAARSLPARAAWKFAEQMPQNPERW